MPWEVPVQVGDQTHSLQFENEPSQQDIDYASEQLAASHEDQPSAFGSFARSAARNVAPTFLGGRLGAMAGGALGGAAEGALFGSEVPVAGNIVGGLIGAAAGMYAASKGQSALADTVDPSASNPFSTASEEKDAETNKYSTMFGGLLAAGKPSVSTLQNALKSTATAEGRNLLRQGFQLAKRAAADPSKAEAILAENPAAAKAFESTTSVGGNVGIGAAQGAVQGQTPQQILEGALGGALFNQGWGHGGERMSDKSGVPAPELPPEVKKNAQAADIATDAANSLDQLSGGNSPTAELMKQTAAEAKTEAAATLPEPEAPKPVEQPQANPEEVLAQAQDQGHLSDVMAQVRQEAQARKDAEDVQKRAQGLEQLPPTDENATLEIQGEEAPDENQAAPQKPPETPVEPAQPKAETPPAPEPQNAPEAAVEARTPVAAEEPKAMASKNADVEARAREAGLPEALKGESIAFKDEFAKQKAVMDNDPHAGEKLVDELDHSPRPVTHQEQALLAHEMIRVSNGLRASDAKLDRTDLTPEQRAAALVQNAHWEDRWNKFQEVNRKAGTQSSLALLARKIGLKNDYSYAGVEKAFRRAKGAPLDKADRDVVDKMSKELQKKQKAYDDAKSAETEGDLARTEEVYKEVKKRASGGERMTREELSKRIKEAFLGKKDKEIKFSLPEHSKADRDYLDAVERGDTETAQRMVDAARLLPKKVFYAGDVEVIRNPSDSDYRQLNAAHRKEYPFDKSGDPTTRFTTDKFGNRWIWRSDHGIHNQIEPQISRIEGREVSQNESNWHPENEEAVVRDANGKVIPISERFPKPDKIRYSRDLYGDKVLPEVTETHQNNAVERLKKSEPGRKVLRDLIIVPDWERAIARKEFSAEERGEGFEPKIIKAITSAEGFFDPVTGKSVVIRDNIRPKAGETPEEAVIRVATHERVGHEGLEALRKLDGKFDDAYRNIVSKIPKAELDRIKQTYGPDPDVAIKEWFAHEFGKLKPDEVPNVSTTFGKLWQAVKDFVARLFGQSSKLDQQVRDLFAAVIHHPEALESRRGFGDVMASNTGKRITPSEDRAYMEAAQKGDTETAQRMVDEAANRAGYENLAFRGDVKDINVFKSGTYEGSKKASMQDIAEGGQDRNAIFLTSNPAIANEYAQTHNRLKTSKELGMTFKEWSALPESERPSTMVGPGKSYKLLVDTSNYGTVDYGGRFVGEDLDSIIANARRQGRDGVIIKNIADPPGVDVSPEMERLYEEHHGKDSNIIAFDPSQIKSADPITRDANGRVIPLSERFNPESNDIRFSLPEEAPEEPKLLKDLPRSVLADIAKFHLTEGDVKEGREFEPDMTEKIRKTLEEEGIHATAAEIRQKMTGYGETVLPSQDEVEKQLRELNVQQRLAAAKLDVAEGRMSKLTGTIPDKSSAVSREMEKELQDEIYRQNLQKKAANERSGPLDIKKQNLENQIKDTQHQVDELKKGNALIPRPQRSIENDEAATKLEEKLKSLREERNKIVEELKQPAPEPGDYFADISRKLDATNKRIATLEAKEKSGDLSVAKKEPAPSHPVLDEAKGKLKAINDRIADARRAASQPERDAWKLQGQIDDAQSRITQLEAELEDTTVERKAAKKKEVDPELQSLRDQIKGLNKAKADAIRKIGAPERERIARENEIEDLEARAKEINDKIESGDYSVEKKEPTSPVHPDIQKARDKVTEANEKMAQKRKEAEAPAKEAQQLKDRISTAKQRVALLKEKIANEDYSVDPVTKKPAPKELQDLRDQIDRLNKALNEASRAEEAPKREAERAAKELKDAQEHVADLEKRLSEGKLDTEKRETKPASPELQAERDKAADLNRQISEARKLRDSHTPITKEQEAKALKAIMDRRQKQINELKRRQRENDFSKVVKKPQPSSSDTEKKAVELGHVRQDYQNKLHEFRLGQRTGGQKFWDNVVRFKRAAILSSVTVLGKLQAAGITRALSTTAEELINRGLHGVLPKALTDKAALEGNGAVTSFAKHYAKAFGKWMDDVKSIYKTGKTDIDVLHGPYHGERNEGFDSLLGKLHYMLKAPVKRAAFDHAMERLDAAAMRADPKAMTDPATKEIVQTAIAAQAYKAANRAIFMQDNAIVKAFQGAISILDKQGGVGPGLARTMRVLFPIVKVPSNMVGEALQYAGGLPLGLVKLAKVWKTIDTLPKEDADLIIRQLKKGSLGGALMTLGFLASGAVGGYYEDKTRRKLGEPKAGGIRIGGVDIPAWLQHSPAFEAVQMGATIRRVAESHNKEGENRGLPAGALAALYGVVSETPLINELTRMSDLKSPEGRENYLGDVAKAQVEPQIMQQVAKWTDPEANRKASNVTENFKLGVPLLRKQVPVRVDSPLPPSDNGKIPKVIEEYSVAGGVMPEAPQRGDMKRRNPNLTEQKFLRYAEKRGQMIKSMLLTDIPQIKNLPKEQQQAAVHSIVHSATSRAKSELGLN